MGRISPTGSSPIPAKWIGIDFSGNAVKWRAGCKKSNVWIAEVDDRGKSRPWLARLFRVQELDGDGTPFQRLIGYLRNARSSTVAIDAPFSIPAKHLPDGGRDALLDAVRDLQLDGRPFPRGADLLGRAACSTALLSPGTRKPLRVTETYWQGEKLSVRSTLWNGDFQGRGRPGAPFTVACLRLIAEAKLRCWPWHDQGEPLLVEAFPAAQLCVWGLPRSGYHRDRDGDRDRRRQILEGLQKHIDIPAKLSDRAELNADALDAIVCALAAIAVDRDEVKSPPCGPPDEGWIAVHR